MSSKERRKEREVRDLECRRRAALTMYERIEEANVGADVKDILHRISEQCGMEN